MVIGVTDPVTASTWDEVFAAFPKGTRYWSYSRFEDYSTCPYRYRLKRIEKVPETTSPALWQGRILHTIILRYTQHLLRTGQATDITAIDTIARDVYYGEPHGLPLESFHDILTLARKHAESTILPPALVSAEEIWAIPVGEQDVMLLVLDQLSIEGSTAEVVDYKTDWHLRTTAEVARDAQLRYYAWAVTRLYPQVDTIRCVMRFVRHQRDREVVFAADDVAGVEDEIRAQIARITSDTEFRPLPGATCQRCGYFDRCPAAPKHPDIVRIATPDDAERVAGEIAVLEQQVAARKAALKEWTAQAGPVTVNGMTWGHLLSESAGVDDVRAFMDRLGDRAITYLAVDARRLRGMPDDERSLIQDLLVDRSRTSFRSVREREGDHAD